MAMTAAVLASAMTGASSSALLQVKPVGKVRSLELAKAAKERLEKKRDERESKRAEIETSNKKKADEKKKLQEEKNKSSKVEVAPKEGIAPSIQVTGTDGAYHLRPQFQSRLPVPRIYWRAEIAKREEARRAQREWVRKIKKSGKVAVKKSDKLGEIEAVIVPSKEEIVPAIKVLALSSPVTKEAIVAAHLTGTDGAYQSRPEVEEERSELYESWPEAHSSPIVYCSNVKIAKKLVGTKGGLGFWRKQEEAERLAKNG